MDQVSRLLKFGFRNFGPLIIYYACNHFYGMRTAIVAAILFGFGEIGFQLAKKEKITHLFKFTMAITLLFGALDLTMRSPIFSQYESTITNIITGMYFGMTFWAPKTVIQEFVEKKNGRETTDRNAILRCQIITGVWALYFFIKAGFYFYVTRRYSIEQALVIRSTVGTASLYGLLCVSLVFGKRIILFFQIHGLLTQYPETAQ